MALQKSKPLETNPIRIYVACLAAYNNGHLHGRWIDATHGENHIHTQVKAMLANHLRSLTRKNGQSMIMRVLKMPLFPNGIALSA